MLKVATSQEASQRFKNLPLRRKVNLINLRPPGLKQAGDAKQQSRLPFINMSLYLPLFTVCCFTKASDALLLLLCHYSQPVWKHSLLMSENSLQHQEVNIFIFMNQLKAIMPFWAKERAFSHFSLHFFPLSARTQAPPNKLGHLVT